MRLGERVDSPRAVGGENADTTTTGMRRPGPRNARSTPRPSSPGIVKSASSHRAAPLRTLQRLVAVARAADDVDPGALQRARDDVRINALSSATTTRGPD